jgi:L-amino acid N-acyltransferase YncA
MPTPPRSPLSTRRRLPTARAAYRWSVDASTYISDSAHRQGIARALYTRLFEILVLQGYRSVYAGITLPNPASFALHKSMGFREVGIYHDVGYKFGKWHDTIWLERPLAEHVADPPGAGGIAIAA